MWTLSPTTTVGAITVSSGGVTCHSGFRVPWTAPPLLRSALATKAERVPSMSTRVNAPSRPLVLNTVPFGARPTTSAASPAVSRSGASSRTIVAVPLEASGAGPDGTTLTLILSVTDSPRVVSATARSSAYSSPLKSGRTS